MRVPPTLLLLGLALPTLLGAALLVHAGSGPADPLARPAASACVGDHSEAPAADLVAGPSRQADRRTNLLPAGTEPAAIPNPWIDPVAESLAMPRPMILDLEAGADAFASHYGGLPDDELVRQLERVGRLVDASYDPDGLTSGQRRRIAGFVEQADALVSERAWLARMRYERLVAPDPGYRLPVPASADTMQRELAEASREELRITEFRLDRQRYLETERACALLFFLGRYKDEPAMVFG